MQEYNSWVEINPDNLKYNVSQFRNVIQPGTKLAAVVKSNAYGHGMVLVAKAIQTKVDSFCTVNLKEALELRKNNIRKPILVLSFYFEKVEEAIKQNISLVVYSQEQIKNIAKAANKLKKSIKLHLKFETGTHRLGVGESEALKLINIINKQKYLKLEGIFSHFAASEENQVYTNYQINNFNRFLKKLDNRGVVINSKHLACSAACLVQPKSEFNLIRLGIGLYGLWPSKLTKRLTLKQYPDFKLRPVMTWKTKVIQIKNLEKGNSVGYGCTFKTTKKTKIAVLPVGYWDGYNRRLSRKGVVLIKNKECHVLGRICMNLMMVDVTGVTGIKLGEEATLLGNKITAENLADKMGTINYAVVTRINPVIPRIIKR